MKKDYPEIVNFVRLLKDEKTIIGQPGQQHYYEDNLIYADSTFFEVFSYSLSKGNTKRALQAPNSVILTKETAKKIFGNTDPLGKTLEINSFGRNATLQVTGIVGDLPSSSHFKFSALVSMQTLGDLSNLWSFHMFNSYVLLNNEDSKSHLEGKFKSFVSKYIINNPNADGSQQIYLQPLNEIHLRSQMVGEIGVNGDITYTYVFIGLAFFILLIACFNFINLSTARSLTRAKEIGLRKVAGALPRQLIKQFLGESFFVTIIALCLSIIITNLFLPVFNYFSERTLNLNVRNNPLFLLVLLGLLVFVGLLSGVYPAMVLSSFKPVEVLKGKFQKSLKGIAFRKVLVVLQFTISIALIASTILIKGQLNFLQNKKLGFDKSNVAIITLPRDLDSGRLIAFKSSLLNIPGITSASAASSIPSPNIPINLVNGSLESNRGLSMQMLFVDQDFIKTMKIKLIAGRDFSRDFKTDEAEAFIINEEALKTLGWKNSTSAISKTFKWVQPNVVLKTGKIVGVVQNFNITPLKSPVQPLVMHIAPSRFQYLYVRFDQAETQNIIQNIEIQFKKFLTNQSFQYRFLEETLNSMYLTEQKQGKIFVYFSIMAIIIGCLGILGLSVYSIQQKLKEIGIRKVLGAGIASITVQLSKEFIKPVIIAAIIATPIAWFGMNKWLENFAYRIIIQWWVFAIAGLLAVLIALTTVSFQAIKAAFANPVKSLRTE